MKGRPRRLWHLSALVGASALAMALAREMSASGGPAAVWLAFLAIAAATYLGSVLVGAWLAGLVSNRLIERGQARGGRPGKFLEVFGHMAYFAVALGVAVSVLAVIFVGMVIAVSALG